MLLAHDGSDHWLAPDRSFWRALTFIESSRSFDTIRDADHAGEVGYALGMFHTLLSDLPPDRLADTLEGFHITPLYLRHYDEVLTKKTPGKSPEVNYCLEFVNRRSSWAHVLENAQAQGAPARLSWARLLKRVFDIDIEHCPNCGGALKIIAAIEDPPVIDKILSHLGLPTRAPPRAPARRVDLFQTI